MPAGMGPYTVEAILEQHPTVQVCSGCSGGLGPSAIGTFPISTFVRYYYIETLFRYQAYFAGRDKADPRAAAPRDRAGQPGALGRQADMGKGPA